VFLLARGVVKVVFAFPDGGRSVLGLRYPGDLVGDWHPDPIMNHPASAIAVIPCEIHRLDADRMRAAEHGDPAAADFHRQSLKRDLCNLAATHLELKGLAPIGRLGRLL
jgi:CRP-like cAMP-binding protein